MFEKRLSSDKKLRICGGWPSKRREARVGTAQYYDDPVSKIHHYGREFVDA